MIKKIFLGSASLLLSLFVLAQDSAVVNTERQATGFRADGKVYVVLVVALTILIGLFIYLIRLDRKITKLEKSS